MTLQTTAVKCIYIILNLGLRISLTANAVSLTLTERLEPVPVPYGVPAVVEVAVNGVGSGPRVAAFAP